ncbi:hypothetical protein K1719_021430 [Acacia pycnantha]|nr:hypothetical protein K1719_021430 [Acacia pycnantha]
MQRDFVLNAKELLFINDSLLMDDLTLMDLAASCDEHACSKFPNNLELMMGLFNCYIHEYSFVKLQQTCIKMYKLVGEERFLLWEVCSIQLQGYLLEDDSLCCDKAVKDPVHPSKFISCKVSHLTDEELCY